MESLFSRRGSTNLHLHYSFPPFSVGEIGKQGMPNRREIGHGNLARAGVLGTQPNCGRSDEFVVPAVCRLGKLHGTQLVLGSMVLHK